MPVKTGIQREVSPIPPGRYWILVNSPRILEFTQWLKDMQGAVRVEASSLDQTRGRANEFVIFRVPEGRMPFLNPDQFGFPNFAPPEVTSRDDVVTNDLNKDPEDRAVDVINKGFETAEKAAEAGPLLLVLLLLALGGGFALGRR